MTQTISGNIVDILGKQIYFADLTIVEGTIQTIVKRAVGAGDPLLPPYILPGFIDSHVHIESAMLVPSEFARLAVVHGTVATISDPHEIANVCGMAGVEFMIANGRSVPFKFFFGAPSCVPATSFETAGAVLSPGDIDKLLQKDEVKYLSEMMNFPGVLSGDTAVMQKIASAQKYHKPVDGHAPGLRGEDAKKYIAAGISTDHECFTEEEALEKLAGGMKILIREGSAAKNFDALVGLLHEHSAEMMFCSDDKHPDSLAAGHINQLCARAVARGIDLFKVLRAACINPVEHYKLNVGQLKEGDEADFILVGNLVDFDVRATYIRGQLVAANGKSMIEAERSAVINYFNCLPQVPQAFARSYQQEAQIAVIEALEAQLITNKLMAAPRVVGGEIVSDTERDLLKIIVLNRYHPAPVATAFVKHFGLKSGAIASTVAHDSHNIIAVGVDDESICQAVNLVIQEQGGISCVSKQRDFVLPLPVAGLMSNQDGYQVAADYTAIDRMVKEELGSTLAAPFMTLSFMALLVIPHLKLSDLGLFDGDSFSFVAAN